jgi:hypothetical protein
MTIIAAISSGLIILGTIGLGSLSSVVILGVLYGASSGVCVSSFPFHHIVEGMLMDYTDNAMLAPLMATLAPNPSELG